MDSKYEVHIRAAGSEFLWVLICDGDVMCYSPRYKTETKTAIEAMFFSTVFGVEFIQPKPEKPKRHLTLVQNSPT